MPVAALHMSAFGTKRTLRDIGGSGLLPCKLTPETHFASRKSLM
jgi:hypothetical protein